MGGTLHVYKIHVRFPRNGLPESEIKKTLTQERSILIFDFTQINSGSGEATVSALQLGSIDLGTQLYKKRLSFPKSIKMNSYAFTPYMLPVLASAAFAAVMGIYGWRRRPLPGALPFAAMCACYLPWAVGAALELAASDPSAKIFWYKFQGLWLLPTGIALLCFALEYSNLGRWLTRRTLTLLALPAIIVGLLLFISDLHLLMWHVASVDETVHVTRTGLGWIVVGYAFALALTCTVVFVTLFLRSPIHRWPVALCICGQITTRGGILVDITDANPFAPVQATILTGIFALLMYAIALFFFGMFELIWIGRTTVIEQMHEGMLVLDSRGRIVDMNVAAEKIIGSSVSRVRGRDAARMMSPYCDLSALLNNAQTARPEICVETNDSVRYYELQISPLSRGNDFSLGSSILFYEVTEQRRTQRKLLEHQRALAALRERHKVARELHDGLGQVLGYVKLQAQAARELLAQNLMSAADSHLKQLMSAVQESHADVREYIMGAREGFDSEDSFFPLLKQYLEQFSENFGISTELDISSQLDGRILEPTSGAQMLRVIQEALTNVRKHTQASGARVSLRQTDGFVQAIVRDNGAGFDPELLKTPEGQRFGLRFMHERMKEVGGNVQIYSAPGEGTQVIICVPIRKEGR